jgi:glycosyltransferase involved in cell wall biosynthesis
MIRKEVFEKLGRFDECYSPAYCEDMDLAFKVREAGLKVYYQPFSVVIHYEGVSHGTDENIGLKHYQVVNQNKFLERWRRHLLSSHYPNAMDIIKARDRSRDRPIVLVIDHYVPQPDQDAGSRTMTMWMELLQEKGMAVKLWPANLYYDPIYTPQFQQRGIEVIYGPEYGGRKGFEKWLQESGRHLDHVLLSRPHIAVDYIAALRKYTNARLHYYGHDIHHLRIREQGKLQPRDNNLKQAEDYWRKLEHRVWDESDFIYYPSLEEAEYAGAWLAERGGSGVVGAVPAYCFSSFSSVDREALRKRSGIMFVGGFQHPPNVDGVLWFASEILPLIQSELQQVHFFVIGSNPSREILALQSPQISVTGFIDDATLEAYYERVRVVVAPLRYGAGVKGKVIEALRYGVPVVTTSTGIQGLKQLHGTLPVADDPRAFAEHIIGLYNSDEAWLKTAEYGLSFVMAHYSKQSVLRELLKHFV